LEINIELLESLKNAPMDLLLLADPSEEIIQEYIQNGKCFIGKYANETVGVIVLLKTRPKTIEIMNIAVKEEFQNKGIGKQLIKYAIEKTKKEGINTIEIGTGNPGVQQMLLYQKCGFRIVGIDFDFFRRNYKEKIYENGIECRDIIRLRLDL
jgi:ribosomal protein S18 acetylase RimI-like enzyme